MNGTPSNHISMLGSSITASPETVEFSSKPDEHHLDTSNSSTSNLSDAEKQKILEELNYQRMQAHIPAMVMISFLMLIGIVGNSLVVYVYKRHFKKTSSNYFIMTMAIFDLLACLIGMPTELYDLNNPYTFYSTASCKILRGCETFTVYGSAVVLVEIAFDRFFKICRPLLRVSLWRIKFLCMLAVVMAALLSIVPLIIFGIEISDTPHPEVKGHDCSFAEEYKNSFLKKIYLALLGALVATILIVLLMLYVKIWWEIRRRRTFVLGDTFRSEENEGVASSDGRQKRNHFGIRYMPSLSEDESINNSVGSPTAHLTSMSLMEMHQNSNGNSSSKDRAGGFVSISPVSSSGDFRSGRAKSPGPNTSLMGNGGYYTKVNGGNTLQHQHSVVRSGDTSSGKPLYQHNIVRGNSSGGLQSQISVEQGRPKLASHSSFTPIRLKMTRTTVVLFAVTVAFVLSYLPTIAVMMIKARFKSLDNSHDFTTNMILKIFSNSFFINNAINPIIYSFLNVNFRRQAKNTFRHIFCCRLYKRHHLRKKMASERSTKREFLTRD